MKTIIPVLCLLFSFLLHNVTAFCQELKLDSKIENGMRIIKYEIPNKGDIHVFLPDKLYSGTSISGTVIADPKGKNEDQISRNRNKLSGYVLEAKSDESTSEAKDRKFTWLMPMVNNSISLLLKNPDGKLIREVTIPMETTPSPLFPDRGGFEDYIIPPYSQTGIPTEVEGPFDGDISNTTIKVADKEREILVEGPGKIVYEPVEDVTGPVDISIIDDHRIIDETINNIDVILTADQLELLKGQSTTLRMAVVGIQDVDIPVTVILANETPENVHLPGGNIQEILIPSNEVSAEGAYHQTYKIEAKESGGFTISANLKVPDRPIYCGCAMDPSINVQLRGPEGVIDINGIKPQAMHSSTPVFDLQPGNYRLIYRSRDLEDSLDEACGNCEELPCEADFHGRYNGIHSDDREFEVEEGSGSGSYEFRVRYTCECNENPRCGRAYCSERYIIRYRELEPDQCACVSFDEDLEIRLNNEVLVDTAYDDNSTDDQTSINIYTNYQPGNKFELIISDIDLECACNFGDCEPPRSMTHYNGEIHTDSQSNANATLTEKHNWIEVMITIEAEDDGSTPTEASVDFQLTGECRHADCENVECEKIFNVRIQQERD